MGEFSVLFNQILSYFDSSFRAEVCASPKLIMSRGFHTGDPTIKKKTHI